MTIVGLTLGDINGGLNGTFDFEVVPLKAELPFILLDIFGLALNKEPQLLMLAERQNSAIQS